jgi:hypothetical protein
MTENEILKATTGNSQPSAATLASMRGFSGTAATDDASGDMDNVENAGVAGAAESIENGSGLKKGGANGAVLTSGALWDYIVEHPLIKLGHIDIADACDRLRRLAKPGKDGPIFPEEEVRRAIEGSRRGGGDALI